MKVKLPLNEIEVIVAAFDALDGQAETTTSTAPDGSKTSKVKYIPYDLDEKVDYARRKNRRTLRNELAIISEKRNELIAEIAPDGKSITPNTPEMIKYNTRMNEFLKGDVEVDVHVFAESGLKAFKNKLPAWVTDVLTPFYEKE